MKVEAIDELMEKKETRAKKAIGITFLTLLNLASFSWTYQAPPNEFKKTFSEQAIYDAGHLTDFGSPIAFALYLPGECAGYYTRKLFKHE
jgi:hypothetical protein